MYQDQGTSAVPQFGNAGGGYATLASSPANGRFQVVDKQIGDTLTSAQELVARTRNVADRICGSQPIPGENMAAGKAPAGGVIDEWSQRLAYLLQTLNEAHAQLSRIQNEV